jgi:hypothetical protein
MGQIFAMAKFLQPEGDKRHVSLACVPVCPEHFRRILSHGPEAEERSLPGQVRTVRLDKAFLVFAHLA